MSYDSDDRQEAANKVDRYYEIMGYDYPDRNSEEYRERFGNELNRIRDGE